MFFQQNQNSTFHFSDSYAFLIIRYADVSKEHKHEPEKWKEKSFSVQKAFVTDGQKCNINHKPEIQVRKYTQSINELELDQK